MPTRHHTAPTHGALPLVEVRLAAGRLTVVGVPDAVELHTRVEALDEAAEGLLDRVTISWSEGPAPRLVVTAPDRRLLASGRFAVTVTGPAGTAVQAHLASADTELRGRAGQVEVVSASGDVAVETCAGLRVRTASGDVRTGPVDGDVEVATASGDVTVAQAGGSCDLRTASGDLLLDRAEGDVSAVTASGDVTVGRAARGSVQLRTVSGDATVAVVPGLRLWLDLQSVSGRVDSALDADPAPAPGATQEPASLEIALRSVSGHLRLRRAT